MTDDELSVGMEVYCGIAPTDDRPAAAWKVRITDRDEYPSLGCVEWSVVRIDTGRTLRFFLASAFHPTAEEAVHHVTEEYRSTLLDLLASTHRRLAALPPVPTPGGC